MTNLGPEAWVPGTESQTLVEVGGPEEVNKEHVCVCAQPQDTDSSMGRPGWGRGWWRGANRRQ